MSSLYVLTLLLVACGGSGTGTSNNTTNASMEQLAGAPPNTTYVDLTQAKLLSDSGYKRQRLPDCHCQHGKMTWLRANPKKIRSLTYDKDFSDLAFLDRLLAGKRIVRRNSHGTRV